MKHHKITKRRKVYYEYYPSGQNAPHPLIRISGKYLEPFGFNVGDEITITLEIGRVTIVKGKQMHNSPYQGVHNRAQITA